MRVVTLPAPILKATAVIAIAAVVGLSTIAPANSDTITFGGLTHGQIVPTTIGNVTFVVDNDAASGPDEGRIFDSEAINSTADPDLQRDPDNSRENWKGGNLPITSDMGNILIIQEHDSGQIPDDEGNRPAGIITLSFTVAITEFGLDLIDIENGGTSEDDDGFLEFFSSGASLGLRSFVSFATTNGPSGVAIFGDAMVNRIDPILASVFGAASFYQVVVRLGGSGGIDNL